MGRMLTKPTHGSCEHARLAVALDVETARRAFDLAEQLSGVVDLVKVGLELYCAEGPTVVRGLRERGFDVFLDLKLHDIPNTVGRTVTALGDLGVCLLTLHATGGLSMLEQAARARDESCPGLKLLAVTVLTSLSPVEYARTFPSVAAPDLSGRVIELAALARDAGADGVVCSPLEVTEARRTLPPPFLLVTPGIRPHLAQNAPPAGQNETPSPAKEGKDDQQRTATPWEAVHAGSDILVVGRPVTRAADPRMAAQQITTQMHCPPAP